MTKQIMITNEMRTGILFEVEASNKFQETLLVQFSELSPIQRAELIEIGFEQLAKLYQRNADKVAGK